MVSLGKLICFVGAFFTVVSCQPADGDYLDPEFIKALNATYEQSPEVTVEVVEDPQIEEVYYVDDEGDILGNPEPIDVPPPSAPPSGPDLGVPPPPLDDDLYFEPFPVIIRCGNGILDKDEECDDRNNESGDGCDYRCKFERCGDGKLSEGEGCDDGNTISGDGCSDGCNREFCGNGVIDPPVEQCDDGPFEAGEGVDGDGCSALCQLEICGNGVVTPNEQCDDGNHTNGDGCDSECLLEMP